MKILIHWIYSHFRETFFAHCILPGRDNSTKCKSRAISNIFKWWYTDIVVDPHPCHEAFQQNSFLVTFVFETVIMMKSSNGNIFRITGPLCGNSPVTGEFPAQRPATRSFDVFFDLRLNKRSSKQSRGWWFETPLRPLWCCCIDWQIYRGKM